MARIGKLAGDLLAQLVVGAGAGPLGDRERNGPADPQSIVELLAYDIAFRTEPAFRFTFPPGADDHEDDDDAE